MPVGTVYWIRGEVDNGRTGRHSSKELLKQRYRDVEASMEENESPATSKQNQAEKKRKSNSFAFLAYAIVVFTTLAIGLFVILMRSSA